MNWTAKFPNRTNRISSILADTVIASVNQAENKRQSLPVHLRFSLEAFAQDRTQYERTQNKQIICL